MIKTVLLTGATGYLGSHLVSMLLAREIECIVVIRSDSQLDRINHLKNKISFCNVDSVEHIFKQKKIDAILHAATCYGRKGEALEQILTANLHFPLKLLQLAHQYDVKLFINIDTVLVPMTNYYSLSKAQFREWGQFFASRGQLKFINIKMQHFYGPNDDETKFTSYVIRACLRNDSEIILSEGIQKRDFIYIDDVVSAFQYLFDLDYAQCSTFEEFELGSGVATAIRDYVLLVHALSNSKSTLKFGVRPEQSHEQDYIADVTRLKNLGWNIQFDLKRGLEETLRKERESCVI